MDFLPHFRLTRCQSLVIANHLSMYPFSPSLFVVDKFFYANFRKPPLTFPFFLLLVSYQIHRRIDISLLLFLSHLYFYRLASCCNHLSNRSPHSQVSPLCSSVLLPARSLDLSILVSVRVISP